MQSPQWRKWGQKNHQKFDEQLVTSLSPSRLPSFAQLKYLPKILTQRENSALAILAVGALISVIFLGFRIYDSRTVSVASPGGSYTEGLVGSIQNLNPILSQNNDADRDLISLVYSGLMAYDADRTLVPDLAERYEISSDQKTYTFYLRHGVMWHDGKPFTANDVIFTIQKIQDPHVKSPLYLSFKDIKINKVDDYTVQLGVDKPFAAFLDLATKRIIPQHAWESVAPESMYMSSLNLKPIGTGPWKYKSLKKEKDGSIRSYVVSRFDGYFGKKPYLDQLVMKMYPDTDSVIQALKNKNVQGISFLPRELRDRLAKKTNLRYYTYNLPQYTAVFFNQSLNADLKSKAVRQALALALDRDRIVREVLAGEGSVINAPILPGFIGYSPDISSYPLDLVRASSLLESAGWMRDEKKHWVRVPPPSKKKAEGDAAPVLHPLTISLVTIQSAENTKVADIIKENWESLGVTVDVVLVDPARIKGDIIDTRNYQALLYGEIIGTDPDLYPFWHSSQAHAPGLNLAVFSNEKADALLEAGRATSDQEKRAESYHAFQQILADEVPALFLYNPAYNYVVDNAIRGIRDKKQIVYPSDRFVDANMWYTKTQRIRKK